MDDLIYIDLALDLGLLHMLRLMLARIIIFVQLRINDFGLPQRLSLSKAIHSVLSEFVYSYYVVF